MRTRQVHVKVDNTWSERTCHRPAISMQCVVMKCHEAAITWCLSACNAPSSTCQFQQSVMHSAGAVREAAMKGSVLRAFIEIGRHGGVRSYWRGNLPQVLRVLPYSAAQLGSYELLKGYLADKQGHLSVECRLLCGAGAGMVSTLARPPYFWHTVNSCCTVAILNMPLASTLSRCLVMRLSVYDILFHCSTSLACTLSCLAGRGHAIG
jgi:hypothetical protein